MSLPPIQIFHFEIVVVNCRGEVIKRENREAEYFIEDLGNSITLEMVKIPGATFMMGSSKTERQSDEAETPLHQVTIPSFFMGKYPLTQAQYEVIMGNNPAYFKNTNRPIEQVSWNNAVEFCQKLSQITGRNYRLPSEAEWEYACRGGTNTPFYFGATITTDLANYKGSSMFFFRESYAYEPKGKYRKKTTKVGKFPPNAFGLYDMHGNIWEFCQDNLHNNYNDAPTDGSTWFENNYDPRVVRGGSWNFPPSAARCAFRAGMNHYDDNNSVGFRVVCD